MLYSKTEIKLGYNRDAWIPENKLLLICVNKLNKQYIRGWFEGPIPCQNAAPPLLPFYCVLLLTPTALIDYLKYLCRSGVHFKCKKGVPGCVCEAGIYRWHFEHLPDWNLLYFYKVDTQETFFKAKVTYKINNNTTQPHKGHLEMYSWSSSIAFFIQQEILRPWLINLLYSVHLLGKAG